MNNWGMWEHNQMQGSAVRACLKGYLLDTEEGELWSLANEQRRTCKKLCSRGMKVLEGSKIIYSKGRRDEKWSRPWTHPSRHPSLSSLCPSVWSSMRIDTLEAPRLPAAHHPSTRQPSLYWAWHCSFLPTKNGKEINQEWPSIHIPI
jgi:hypothetical protein